MKRLNYYQVSPEPINKLSAVSQSLASSGLDPRLRLLVELRVSQINGCVYCVNLHSKQARQAEETQQRLDSLPVWHEAPYFTERERAALAWAEALTNVSSTRAPDAIYDLVARHFPEKELVDLSLVISVMNAWNRIAIGFRKMPD
ncbi:MAG TPA: carboxymuconolactone decarboxylase family protein [Candidatus Limnocylindria bacterium]|jgi:uncharacterized peroxidase-related enzyme|nr:carboxymuconolactone decarboxylase family protein [Candidatus Limnocylindria bacterium]